jgi:hypothetical protein
MKSGVGNLHENVAGKYSVNKLHSITLTTTLHELCIKVTFSKCALFTENEGVKFLLEILFDMLSIYS